MLVRLRVALRRARPADEGSTFVHDGLHVDLTIRRVTVDDNEISLTATEYALLRLLVRHAGRVLPYSHMLREVWQNLGEGQRKVWENSMN